MPCDYKKYHKNWKIQRARILERAQNKCELCHAINYAPHPITGSKVILTIAHLDQYACTSIEYADVWLLALCQRCHLKLDLPFKLLKRRKVNNEICDSISHDSSYLILREQKNKMPKMAS